MTSKSDYSEEEWDRIRRAPFVAGMAISIADPGGPIEVAKETMASVRSATVPPSEEELLLAAAHDIQASVQKKQNPLGGFKPTNSALAGQEVLEELSAVKRLNLGTTTAV